jgi:anti-anti-sigma regulatory factor
MLDISSKVLLDFAGVESFSSACINELVAFDRKLRHRGSRTVLCSLAPDTRACFFQAR